MYCSKCGNLLPEEASLCPHCQTPTSPPPIEHSQKKKWPLWFKLLFIIISIGILLAFLMMLLSTDPQESLVKHLNSIQTNQLTEAYYDYTTKEFQSAVSLEKFKEFIKNNEILFQSKTPLIEELKEENGQKIYEATFMLNDKQVVRLNYYLKEEGGIWKIQDIKIGDFAKSELSFDSAVLVDVILKWLQDLKKGEIKEAYEKYTSKLFKEATSFEIFKQFIEQHALFTTDPSPNFSNISFKNGVAIFKGSLTTPDHQVHLVEFDLAQEEGQWKILEIRLFNQENTPPEDKEALFHPLEMEKIVIGNQVDLQGLILKPSNLIGNVKEELYVNLYIKSGKTGSPVQLILHHLESGSKTVPFKSLIKTEGASILDFVFSPPASGWPKGKYELIASSPHGAPITHTFTVQ